MKAYITGNDNAYTYTPIKSKEFSGYFEVSTSGLLPFELHFPNYIVRILI